MTAIPERKKRIFLSDDLIINHWSDLEPYFKKLLDFSLGSVEDLKTWMGWRSELEAVIEEELAWRYIRMNIDTTDMSLAESFQHFIQTIEPEIAPYHDKFNKKLIESEWVENLDKNYYKIPLRSVRKQIELFREKNIPLNTQLQSKSQEYGAITGTMSVDFNGEQLTMQQAAKLLKEPDSSVRQDIYAKIAEQRLQHKNSLNTLLNELIELRQQVAANAGFDNYRDYKFEELGRFDYSKQDCFDFHESIQETMVPITRQFDEEQKRDLGVDKLMPWDTQVDPKGKKPLKPFESGSELLEKSITCFSEIDSYFGECLTTMGHMKHLDLESKQGKAPGGFNYPLYEIGVPFIYMNAVGSQRDLVTMVHEGGHAVHSFLTRDLELVDFKSLTSEIAELASMSMELISMEHWDVFYKDKDELLRAKKDQLKGVLETLPWVAQIDKFQHWLYENRNHTNEERNNSWLAINAQFGSNVVDWSGNEESLAYMWQKQLHIYEVPFYYIEYGMAQLGAIAVWRNYKNNPSKAIEQYKNALSLGYTKSISEVYEAAGIRFDFSKAYVKELADFVQEELNKLEA